VRGGGEGEREGGRTEGGRRGTQANNNDNNNKNNNIGLFGLQLTYVGRKSERDENTAVSL
jgi:hypothetical protein